MSDPQMHRASLLLALVGLMLMLTVAMARLQPGDGPTLPNRSSQSGDAGGYFVPRG